MSESARKKQRTSTRESEGQDGTEGTLYADLHAHAHLNPKPVTPFRRAASAGVTPNSRRTPNVPIRTPGTGARTPRGGPATRPIPSRRTAPTTPHAIRALRERAHAARTPGHTRRRSGRIQRETPRDILRDLSRVLARNTQPTEPHLQARPPRNSALDFPEIEDGPDPAVPRLSMPLEDMYDDDSIHEAPPRQSLLPHLPDDVDNGTIQSLEFGRRAISEDPRMFGTRVSERFADLTELGMDGEEYEIDGTFINRRQTLDPQHAFQEGTDDDTTTDIRALTGRRDGRPSDVDLGVFGDLDDEVDEPTFRFTIPQRIQAAAPEDQDEEEGLDASAYDERQNGVYNDEPLIDEQADDNEAGEAAATAEGEDATGVFEAIGWESEHDVEDDAELEAYREETSAIDRSLQTQSPERPTDATKAPRRQRRELMVSAHGLEYPSFPAAVVKRLATGFAKSQGSNGKLSKDTVAVLAQTSDWFFEQVSEDLAAYARHGGRKMIEESDVIAIMKRQRQITSNSTVFSLAQKLLPRELLQQLRMEPLPKAKGQRQKRKRMETIDEES
ncbi:centromere kinetochore component CENP-T-domain-containing protein [Massariosphaeria phaeospora]|uniref:Centromere kinetochore component CENP-T-domain-containing protein n=1 Tax=Massariosphaeria phaeospora TaxID=100035 RepID=A0A7C8MML6_9PLEO|nr:centromere kinetochore component CENP-T-domain-containing protein [Massariosphaeria phaeospora]